jgi:glutaryl-CoA dehydrogenase
MNSSIEAVASPETQSQGATGLEPAQPRLYEACDPYQYEALLTEQERDVLRRLRQVLETSVKPLVNEYWDRGEFPEAIREPIEQLGMVEPAPDPDGPAPRALFKGFRMFELARTDVSTAVFFGGQATMFRTPLLLGGSEQQVARLDPGVRTWQTKGVIAITEPEHGSDVAGGLETSARREGEQWVINGAKRWIGGAAYADLILVLARDTGDGQVKAFLVDGKDPGVTIQKIERKISVRIVNNAHITLTDVRVPESMRLQKVNSFRDMARLFRYMRADVAWMAAGAQAGAYEAALRYVTARKQFGHPLASFQLVQDKLATMLGNLTASLSMAVRLAQLQDQGIYRDEDSAMAKSWISKHLRETVALGRELAGGNGITLDTDVARFFADAEAIYTFEGTFDINQLVLGRAITGTAAFAPSSR